MSQTDELQLIEDLIKKLKAPAWPDCQRAVEALVKIGEPAVLPLIHAGLSVALVGQQRSIPLWLRFVIQTRKCAGLLSSVWEE